MCGIAGFSNFYPQRDYDRQALIQSMCDAIAHRGPDEWDYFHDPLVSFGHRRLSIVGLNDGRQPMSLGSRYTISFNGEIYNFRELRAELLREGFKFQTQTDTELILQLYAKEGVASFSKLNGMFAFAIWDALEEQLIFARDRAGKKPFFYFYDGRDIVFASELKALVKHPICTKKLSMAGLDKFLTYEYIPSPHTIFESTYKVEAAEYIIISRKGLHKDFYWHYPSQNLLSEDNEDEKITVDRLDILLQDAVRMRLQADVPVGVFLSGGIDSSLITAVAAKQTQGLKSFSMYFDEQSYDESVYIEDMVKRLGLDHYSETLRASDMLELFPRLGSIMDEPMADASLVPTYFLSKIAASRVKTVLGGDGADELFAGYPTYIANKLVNIYNIVPYQLRNLLTRTMRDASVLPVSTRNMSWDHLIKQFFRGAGIAGEIRFFRWMGGFLESEKQRIYTAASQSQLLGHHPYEDLSRYLSRVTIYSELDRLLYLSQKLYLTDDILVKVDRASMMNSLEVRAPFLDYRLVEFAASLHERFKLNGFKSKYILKKLASRYLPSHIINRPKKGFGIPIAKWLQEDLRNPMQELLSAERLKSQGIFDYAGVQSLVEEHLSHKNNNRKLLWSLLCFQLWAEEFKI